MLTGRAAVRSTLANFIKAPNVDGINQVFTSFPKRIDFQTNALPSQLSRTAAVIFVESEKENRLAIGGATNGIKRVEYSIVIQLFHHSSERKPEDAMDDFDKVIENLKTKLRSDHQFGDPSGIFVWEGAEPVISVSYGEPDSSSGTYTDTWASVRFDVTQMIQAQEQKWQPFNTTAQTSAYFLQSQQQQNPVTHLMLLMISAHLMFH